MGNDAAGMSLGAVFPKINALPSAEHQPAVGYWNAQIDTAQCRPHMRWHIVVTLSRVVKKRITIGSEAGKKAFQIATHLRIRIFLDQQRGRRVLDVQRQKSCLDL